MIDGKLKTETYTCTGGINTKASPYLTAQNEFLDLVNVNFSQPGALTKRWGTTISIGASVAGRITSGVEFERLSGASYIIATANTNAYFVSGGAFTAFRTGLLNGGLFDFVPFVDRLFAANGQDFFKTDGVNTSNFGLPVPAGFSTYAGFTAGNGLSGSYYSAVGLFNDRGFFGPISHGVTVSLNGISFNVIAYSGFTIPPGYGVSGIQLYRSSVDGLDLFNTRTIVGASVVAGATFLDIGSLGITNSPTSVAFTLIPKYLELYNNQLFMAGFSGFLSTQAWSDIGEPESIQPDFNTEYRTNDGDRITGQKNAFGSLIVTKFRSMHRLTGDDPSNFLQTEISDQYGCISNRAMVSWENQFWCLDSKGIVEFDGTRPIIVSAKVEPIFTAMNVDAASENACALHVRDLNELWFAIPINGATMNNCVVSFDYLTRAWTTYKGMNISSLFMARGTLDKKTPFYTGYTGNLFNFGASYMGDNGSAITCSILTRFQSDEGQTSERQYRRFYLNVDPVLGATQSIEVRLRSNFGSSIQATRTMYQAPFQSRIDFGIAARSIQAEVNHVSATLSFKLPGYAFESRKQRDV